MPTMLILSLRLYFLLIVTRPTFYSFFFFNDTATTEIYTLSLHDALPIYFLGNLIEKRSSTRRVAVRVAPPQLDQSRSEEHTSELQSQSNLVCRLLLEKKKKNRKPLLNS